MILKTEISRTFLNDAIAAGLIKVAFLNGDDVPREVLYQSLIERLVDQAMHECIVVNTDYTAISPESINCDKGDIEECPECGHCEVSDGYGGNDCPVCNEAMVVRIAG